MTRPTNATTKTQKLKFGHYYIADVAFGPNNPIHRAIAFDIRPGSSVLKLLRSGYETDDQIGPCIVANINQMAHFEIVCEIDEMHPTKDSYKLPEKAS